MRFFKITILSEPVLASKINRTKLVTNISRLDLFKMVKNYSNIVGIQIIEFVQYIPTLM